MRWIAMGRPVHIDSARLQHLCCAEAAQNPIRARHEAEIERTDAGSRCVQHRKAVPVVTHSADLRRELRCHGQHSRTIGPRQSALPDDHQRVCRLDASIGLDEFGQ